MDDREKKRGGWKYKSLNISRTNIAFSKKKKKKKLFFIVFEVLSFGEKIKNSRYKS